MASILKVDSIRGTGQNSDTVTLDGSGNITIPKNVTFSGTFTAPGLSTVITNNTTGGTASELVFDLSMDTSYLYQRYEIEQVYSSGGGDIYWRSRRASDNTFFTGSNSYAYAYHYAATGGSGGSGNSGSTYGRINGYGIGNESTEPRRWIIDIYDNATNGLHTHALWRNSGWYNGGHCDEMGMTMELATTTTNQWKMYNGSGGTLTYSGYVHYGIKRA